MQGVAENRKLPASTTVTQGPISLVCIFAAEWQNT